jgi:hypothetical protein
MPSVIEEWKRRLLALEPRSRFAGYAEAEIAGAETWLGFKFPADFRRYLGALGRAQGELFRGSDLAELGQLEQFREDALDLLSETDPTLSLPPQAIVFLFHQGYQFLYLLDGRVMQWIGSEREPFVVNESFEGLVNAELDLMEKVGRR